MGPIVTGADSGPVTSTIIAPDECRLDGGLEEMLTTGLQTIQRQGRKIRRDMRRANERLGQASIDKGMVVSPSSGEAAMDIKANRGAVFCINAACLQMAPVRHRFRCGPDAFEGINRYIGQGLSKARKARD